jgi:acyl-coenzyme A synthetase/AMP-(fatty) acid ligase
MKALTEDADCLWLDPATGVRVTYGELREQAGLEEVEWRPWLCPETPGEAVLGLLTALLIGQELTLVDADLSAEEARAVGATQERLAEVRRVPGRRFESAATMIDRIREEWKAGVAAGFRLTLFTSGSTGLPKQVTHRLDGLARMLRLGERHREDVWGLAYNPTHIAGVQVILQAFFNGNVLVHLFGLEPAKVWSEVSLAGISHLSATPSFYRMLLAVAEAKSNSNEASIACGVRAITLGGERSDEGLRLRLAACFPAAKIRNVYASTEAGALFASEGDIFTLSTDLVGKVRIVDGELQVASALLGEFAGGAAASTDGWYRTGDTVELVSNEPLRWRIMSRQRDWVNVGGHKVNPAEVEAVLLAYPGVREARVYGRDNSVLGQILCAEVVAASTPEEVDLRTYLAERLQGAKVPRLIRVVDRIARGRTGKQAGA